MKEKLRWALVIVVSMVLGGSVVVGVDSLKADNKGGTTVIERQVQAAGGVSTSTVATKSVSDVSQLYSKVRSSVVQINAATSKSATGSLGSGIVLDKQGHILTNNHVINGFDQIDVTLADGTASTAKVVGVDAGNDFAVLQVNLPADKLQPANLGDSDKVVSGQAVIAVGN